MAQVVETSSNPVIDYYSLALAVPPTDLWFKEWYVLRDKNCTIAGYNRFLGNYTVNAITSNTHSLRYFLDPLLGAQTYDLSDMFFMRKIKVIDKDDNQIATKRTVMIKKHFFSNFLVLFE